MRLNFGSGRNTFGMTTSDVPGMYRLNRFIIISEISSKTIPNILDIFFGLLPGVSEMVEGYSKKTRVIVINSSEVYGTYYGLRNSRTRNVYIHHGMADCSANEIQGDTPIFFSDVDWNVIVDKPDEARNNTKISSVGEVNLSYDSEVSGDNLFRPNTGSKKILIPTPLFYDEKDMVIVGNCEEDYMTQILDTKESIWASPENTVKDKMYTATLNDLIDSNTKIFKLNINVENLSSFGNNSTSYDRRYENFDTFIEELCAQAKFSLEKWGFSSGEIIFSGKNGYNVSNLKSYMNLSDIEKRMNYLSLCYDLDSLNEESVYRDDIDISVIMTLNYSNIHVKIIDRWQTGDRLTTDSNVLGLSQLLKESTAMSASMPY
jgi:hypothetical protein